MERSGTFSRKRIRDLYDFYNMKIARNPVTNQAWGIYLDTSESIPELDAYQVEIDKTYTYRVKADKTYTYQSIQMQTEYFAPGFIRYTIICPKTWFDLAGWKD